VIRFRIPTLILLLCLAGILRLAYFDFGLPRWPHSAETEALTRGESGILIAAMGINPTREAGDVSGRIVDPACSSSHTRAGRLVGAILGCASVFLAWVVAGKLYGQLAALVAAALLATHPLASFWSRFALRETAVGLLCLLGFLLVVKSSQKKARLSFFVAGFVLVAGSLEGILALLLWTALLYTMKSSPPDLARISLFILLLGLAAFVFDGPILLAISLCILAISGLFLHFSGHKSRRPSGSLCVMNSRWAMLGGVAAIFASCYLGGELGASRESLDALHAAAAPRLFDFGALPILIAASVGLGWAVVRAKGEDLPWLAYGTLALGVGFFDCVHASSCGVASVPILCVFAAAGVEGLLRMLKSSFGPLASLRQLAPTLILIILVLSLLNSISSVEKLSKKATFDAALEWLQLNAPQGARIAVERGSLILSSPRFDTMLVESASDYSPQFYAEHETRFIVISESNVIGAHRDISKAQARGVGYAKLFSRATGVATFVTSASSIGPMIIVITI